MTGKAGSILIVDDNKSILTALKLLLGNYFNRVVTLPAPTALVSTLRSEKFDVVLLDMNFSAGINNGNEGLYWLSEVKKESPASQVVLFTAYADIDLAVKAIKKGAVDFVVKPWDNSKLIATLQAAYNLSISKQEVKQLREIKREFRSEASMFWGDSEAMRTLRQMIEKVAPTDATILIAGENGTGKELAARALHAGSRRADAPMIAVNCAAIPEELIESELFGHEKGAFTSADQARAGRFEMANNGTLFLDEIGDMSLKTQAKILRILQEQSFMRVGGDKIIPVDVRVIAATNKNLEEAIAAGTFREDLYYRLRVVPLHLPPLRERGGDLDLLLAAFTERLCRVHACKAPVYAPETMERLRRYPWPGNVRELRNFAERMVILFGGKTVLPVDLPPEMTPQGKPEPSAEAASAACEPAFLPQSAVLGPDLDFKKARAVFEARYLEAKLHECGGNITRLAETIGLERSYLHRKLKGYGISSE